MKHFLLVLSTLAVTGCAGANTHSRPGVEYMSYYKIDCAHAHEQYQYIDSLTPTPWERQSAKLFTTTMTGQIGSAINGEYQNRMDIASGRYDANISMIKHNIRSQCGYKDYE